MRVPRFLGIPSTYLVMKCTYPVIVIVQPLSTKVFRPNLSQGFGGFRAIVNGIQVKEFPFLLNIGRSSST